MSLAAHRFERVKFWIFVLIFFHSACLKKTTTNICCSKFKAQNFQHFQIDELPRTYVREQFIKTEMAFFVFSKMKPNFHWGGWLRKHWRPWTISRKNLTFGPLVGAHYMFLRILWLQIYYLLGKHKALIVPFHGITSQYS